MPKYPFYLLLLSLLACADDPLAVTERTADWSVPTDGRAPFGEDYLRTLAAPATVDLLDEHGDLDLLVTYRAEPGTEARLFLRGRHPVSLPTADVTPGVWQTLEVTFQAATDDTPARIIGAYLNGNLLTGQRELAATDQSAGSLRLEVVNGTLEIGNLRRADHAGRGSYLDQNGEVVLQMPLVDYAYYEFEPQTFTHASWGTARPKKTGVIQRFDVERLKERGSNWALRFTGRLDVPRSGTYRFTTQSASDLRLYIDDRLVTEKTGVSWLEEVSGEIELGEGSHDLRLDFIQNGGWGFLELSYEAPGGGTGHLNDLDDGTAIARPPGEERLILETDGEPYLLRSFVLFPNPKVYAVTEKRTHAISVGEAAGPHYTVDLRTGALLRFWRGGFVDVREMWHERGEPQTASPLGNARDLAGRPQWRAAGGDSLAAFRHLRYDLDAAGRPTFHYDTPDGAVTDHLRPEASGLVRTLTNGSATTLETVLASGTAITETGPGAFTLQQPGVNLDVIGGGGLILESGAGGAELLARLQPGQSVTYSLNW